jgi:hypothetical protein
MNTVTVAASAPPGTTAGSPAGLSVGRLHAMRAGYLLIGVGLAIVKWPRLSDAHTQPFYDGVTLCLLTAMSLLAFLGLRYPVKLLPLLLFESVWKVLWLGLVALPQAVTGTMDAHTTDNVFSCSLVVLILAAIPWRYVWRHYVHASADAWR